MTILLLLACLQAPDPDRLEEAFRILRTAVEKDEVPGAVALVARRGTVVRHEAFGLADVEGRVPFRRDTLCWIVSLTKPVTVAAAMTLVDAGRLSLDDPVEKYLPEFKDQKDRNGEHHPFTIRQLMSHSSGLLASAPTQPALSGVGRALNPAWLRQNLADVVRPIAGTELQFKPGTRTSYSNAGDVRPGSRRRNGARLEGAAGRGVAGAEEDARPAVTDVTCEGAAPAERGTAGGRPLEGRTARSTRASRRR